MRGPRRSARAPVGVCSDGRRSLRPPAILARRKLDGAGLGSRGTSAAERAPAMDGGGMPAIDACGSLEPESAVQSP